MRVLFVILAVLLVVPSWTGETRLDLLGPGLTVAARRVAHDATRARLGGLTYIGGVELTGSDPAFGGYSSLAVAGDRFTLLSDGGNILRFSMGEDWQPRDASGANLPAGPGTGWEKRDRDSESMATDERHVWVGFEGYNQIWRYDAGFARADAWIAPKAMRAWSANGGPESLVALPDGRFLTISEMSHSPKRRWEGSEKARLKTRDALIFAHDPVADPHPRRFAVVEQRRYDISDAAALPNGDVLLLNRKFVLPFRFVTRITRVRAARIRAGAVVVPETIATLGAPLIGENFEGIAVTRERDATMIWIVSDDNQSALQRTLLLKFRLDAR
ncbi:esterase-like activity of phytase family protein [Sphingomonas oligophenolica]|uniref:Esterase-like activity of phytase family protein n=1 Tax=Sphingomonas oligophenolica TaxID=301154 RepID=A0A502CLF6_9SPHN|nr:esterase-like activity of phytase family protein [Sphingomonas oligophenolica]TPG13748.1 esterase-like activity of phytase family protein [Sphingomonas oligophenolica]